MILGSTPDEHPATVRLATSQDAGPITALSLELGYPSSVVQVRRRLRVLLGDRSHAVQVAVRPVGGELVGWIHVFVRVLVVVDRHAEIGGLVVTEEQRGRGIGHLLMTEAEHWALGQGCTSIYVRSNVEREAAHEFYRNLGYDQVKAQGVLRKSL